MSDDIGKLADEVIGRMKTTKELKHVPFEMYARVLDRAERAGVELKAMRAVIQRLRDADARSLAPDQRFLDICDAALNRSPKGVIASISPLQ